MVSPSAFVVSLAERARPAFLASRARLCGLGVTLTMLSLGCATAAPPSDRSFRTSDTVLQADVDAFDRRCARTLASDPGCRAALCALASRERELFAAVRDHRFTDLTESNYWHRGRLKFPSRIAQHLQQASEAGRGQPPCPQ